MIWTAIGLLTLIVLGLLLRPLWRPVAPSGELRPELAIYRDQLAELEADRARGLIGDEAAAVARLEIERRLLAVPDAAPAMTQSTPQRRRLAAVLAILVGAISLGLYLELGRPDLPDAPVAGREGAENADSAAALPPPPLDPAQLALLEDDVAKLEASLDENPSQRDAWVALGNRLIELGRYRDAIDAFDQAIAQGSDDRFTQSRLGVALTLNEGGAVSPEAETAFRRALVADANDIAAAYWLAIRELQLGRGDAALRQLIAIEQALPPDAPQRQSVAAVIADVAQRLGIDPDVAREQMASDGGLVPDASQIPEGEDQEAFILSMVEGLAAKLEENPDDLEGWQKLGRSWTVLGDYAKAEAAYGRAADLAPDDPEALLDHALAILATVPSEDTAPLPPSLGERVAQLLAIRPDDPTGLYLAGLDRARAGDSESARTHWERLIAILPPDAPQRAQIEAELQALPAE
jgi:cytochrome c-type biogenesis protein CcmH